MSGPGEDRGTGQTPFGGPRINPVDPGLSPDPGREKRRLVVPISLGIAAVLGAFAWWLLSPRGNLPPELTFDNPQLGCTFTVSSVLRLGPNFVRSPAGSMLTIERHSLFEARKDWLAELPDVLFPQVLIQIHENYVEVEEVSRAPRILDDREGLEVLMRGQSRAGSPPTLITIVIAHTEDWVYVIRAYWLERLDASERPLFERVLDTWKFTEP